MTNQLEYYLEKNFIKGKENISIAKKILDAKQINVDDCYYLYKKADTGFLALLATYVRHKKNKSKVFFIRNTHLEPSNICVYNCKFCSFNDKSGILKGWNHSYDTIMQKVAQTNKNIKEIHITGACHPDATLKSFIELITLVRNILPEVHIKAFSAAELFYVCNKGKIPYEKGIKTLIKAGLNSIPGGGAEIFDEKIRKKICPEKVPSAAWLKIHKTAHQCGLFSNATMLYGHIENFKHRIDHMLLLRNLQTETSGFKAFIPLKYKKNNTLRIQETTLLDDMRNYAIARIFLDNFPHLKAYWPMLGEEQAQLSLSFGVDDIDGTIDDTTKIYNTKTNSKNSLSTGELKHIISQAGFKPVQRDSDYRTI